MSSLVIKTAAIRLRALCRTGVCTATAHRSMLDTGVISPFFTAKAGSRGSLECETDRRTRNFRERDAVEQKMVAT